MPGLNLSFLYSLLFWPSSRAEILKRRNTQLHLLVKFAYEAVPYYRTLFDKAGLRPEDIRDRKDLNRIPFTSKADYEKFPREDFVNPKARKLYSRWTSGSSGKTFEVRRSLTEEYLMGCHKWRLLASFGVRPFDRVARIGHISDSTAPPRFLRYLRLCGFPVIERISSLSPARDIITRLCRFRPDVIQAHPSTLVNLSDFLTDRDLQIIQPRFIAMGGETITKSMRGRIAETFSCRVIEVYGSHELNWIAVECPRTGLFHISDDTLIVEIVQNGKAVNEGEWGEVVGSALYCFNQPLIRYRLEDMVLKGPTPCPCGMPFSTMGRIEGRKTDWIILPNGEAVPPQAFFIRLWEIAPWIRQYQLVQESRDLLVLKLVSARAAEPEELDLIRQAASSQFGTAMTFKIEFVPGIPLIAGKYRSCLSKIHSYYEPDVDRTP